MNKQSKDQKQEKKSKPEIYIKICQTLPPNLTSKYLSKNITKIYKQLIKKRHIKIFIYPINNK